MNTIFKRYSVRKYQSRSVEFDKIELLLKAGMAAPSAHNQQPWEYFVITDPYIKEQLSHTTPYASFIVNAPLVIVPCYNQTEYKGKEYVLLDMSASTQNILLEAVELGLGGVWIGIAPIKSNIDNVINVLKPNSNLIPFAIIPIGYPDGVTNVKNKFDPTRVHYIKEEMK